MRRCQNWALLGHITWAQKSCHIVEYDLQFVFLLTKGINTIMLAFLHAEW